MKLAVVFNPENGTCKRTLSFLYQFFQKGFSIEEVILVLENTYHAEKWVLSLSMPLSKEEIETIKKRYQQKILSEWEALSGNTDLPLKVEVNESSKVVSSLAQKEIDFLILGCLENKNLCKLIEKLDIPTLIVKN